jgi:hypothetical protein
MLMHRREAFATIHHTGEGFIIKGVVLAAFQVLNGVPNGDCGSVPAGGIFAPQEQQNAKSGQLIHRGRKRLRHGGKFFDFPRTNAKARYTSDHGSPRCLRQLPGGDDSTARQAVGNSRCGVLDRQRPVFRLIGSYAAPAPSSAVFQYFLLSDLLVAAVNLSNAKGSPEHYARHGEIDVGRTDDSGVVAVVER